MTREEAIKILTQKVSPCLNGTEWGDALQMAIDALKELELESEQEMHPYDVVFECESEEHKEQLIQKVARRWISVSEKMPESDEPVLVSVHFSGSKKWNLKASDYVDIAKCFGDEWKSSREEYLIFPNLHRVYAWQSLPDPWKEDE